MCRHRSSGSIRRAAWTRCGPARSAITSGCGSAARDGGGDLGRRDTLVLEYAPEDPAGGPSAPERFYFGRGAGWYEWSRGDIRKRFNVVGGPSVNVIREVVCG
jgi:hypothetical protein